MSPKEDAFSSWGGQLLARGGQRHLAARFGLWVWSRPAVLASVPRAGEDAERGVQRTPAGRAGGGRAGGLSSSAAGSGPQGPAPPPRSHRGARLSTAWFKVSLVLFPACHLGNIPEMQSDTLAELEQYHLRLPDYPGLKRSLGSDTEEMTDISCPPNGLGEDEPKLVKTVNQSVTFLKTSSASLLPEVGRPRSVLLLRLIGEPFAPPLAKTHSFF